MAFISISITKNHPLILGKGGFGRQLADWLSAEGWGEAEFLDDSAPGCVGGLRDYADPELLQKLAAAGYDTPVFISDMAAVSPSAVLEPGCVILPQAYVGADAHLGVGCIINGGAIVDHDAVLGRGVHVAPGGIVKAGAEVEALTKVDSGEIIKK